MAVHDKLIKMIWTDKELKVFKPCPINVLHTFCMFNTNDKLDEVLL